MASLDEFFDDNSIAKLVLLGAEKSVFIIHVVIS